MHKTENIQLVIDEIDCLLLDEFENQPGIRWYKQNDEAEGCTFPTPEDQKEAWEVLRSVAESNGFLDCEDMLVRPNGIVHLSEGKVGKDPCIQISLRGGGIVCVPYSDPAVLRTDIEVLRGLIGGGTALQ